MTIPTETIISKLKDQGEASSKTGLLFSEITSMAQTMKFQESHLSDGTNNKQFVQRNNASLSLQTISSLTGLSLLSL